MSNRYEFHDLAKTFPKLEKDQLNELVNDIAENGLLRPIVLYEGKILDGCHRYRACLKAGVTPFFEEYAGNDPVGYVISCNLRRRHLKESQRAVISGELAKFKHGGSNIRNPGNFEKPNSKMQICTLSLAEAADMMNVSRRSAASAKKVIDYGDESLIERVRNGELSVSAAVKLIDDKTKVPKPKSPKDEAFAHLTWVFKEWVKATKTETDPDTLKSLAKDMHDMIDETIKVLLS